MRIATAGASIRWSAAASATAWSSTRSAAASATDDAFIKGWFVYATNLPMTLPGATEQIKAAAESLELMVVIDTMPAEITGYADVVLPECTYLERYDDLRNKAERTPTLALRMPAFKPRYQSEPAWWMAKQLAERLGLGRYFPWQHYTFVLDWQLKQVGSSLAEMQQLGIKRFPRKTPLYFDEGADIKFNTPSGKIELAGRACWTRPGRTRCRATRRQTGRRPVSTISTTGVRRRTPSAARSTTRSCSS